MSDLVPEEIFRSIVRDLPKSVIKDLIVAGSLAAAYHFRDQLQTRAINTKDADVLVQPAGNIETCRALARKLLGMGWRHAENRQFPPGAKSTDPLPAIRLVPKDGADYFLELLGLPRPGQRTAVKWQPIELKEGWYGLPCFRFMALIAYRPLTSKPGLRYARPEMMALSNLLSHPTLGTQTLSRPVGDRDGILRSCKDLGRVVALAWLAGREGTEAWRDSWAQAYPQFQKAGGGLRELLDNGRGLDDAYHTARYGLLRGLPVTLDAFRATAARLLSDLLD